MSRIVSLEMEVLMSTLGFPHVEPWHEGGSDELLILASNSHICQTL